LATQPIRQNRDAGDGSATDAKGLAIPVIANVTNVEVDCKDIRPSITGSGVGLKTGNVVVLINNGGDLRGLIYNGPLLPWLGDPVWRKLFRYRCYNNQQTRSAQRLGTGAGVIDNVNDVAISLQVVAHDGSWVSLVRGFSGPC
jgi:hypothetical protein